MKKFTADVIRIGEWISGCKNEMQIRNLEDFYSTVISRQWYPDIDEKSIFDSLAHLDKMVTLQINKITKPHASHFSKL